MDDNLIQGEDKNPIQVAGRLFGAVEYLAANGAVGLMELSEALGLNKSTTHRILSSLQYMGYVKQEAATGRYRLSFRIVDLSNQVMSRVDIIGLVHPYLHRLMEITGETVHFVRREGTDAVYIDKVASDRNSIQLVSRIGSHIPLYCSGVGKAMMATMPTERVEQIWKESAVRAVTPHTITDYQQLQRTLSQIREQGYAMDDEENEEGVRCVATALITNGGSARYAFSISAPVSRMDDQHVKELIAAMLDVKQQIDAEFRG